MWQPALVVGLVFMVLVPGRAQSIFQPGYVIRSNGDSVAGEVDYRGTAFNSGLCRFRPQHAAPVEEYRPTEVRAYGTAQVRMEALRVKADTGEVSYFMRVVTRGRARLWLLQEEATAKRSVGERLFVQGPADAAPMLLRFFKESTDVFKAVQRTPSGAYRGTLATSLGDCDQLQLRIAQVEPSFQRVTDLVKEYNRVCGAAVEPAAAPVPALGSRLRCVVGVQVGIGLGGSFSIRYPKQTHPAAVLDNAGAGAGLTLAVRFGRSSPRFSLQTGVLYARHRYEGTAREQELQPQGYAYQPFQIKVALDYLRIPLALRYTWPTGRLRPFGQLGIALNQVLKVRQDTYYPIAPFLAHPTGIYQQSPYLIQVRSFEPGVLGGLGVVWGRVGERQLCLEFRAEFLDGPARYDYDHPYNAVRTFYALVSYDLTK